MNCTSIDFIIIVIRQWFFVSQSVHFYGYTFGNSFSYQFIGFRGSTKKSEFSIFGSVIKSVTVAIVFET